MRRKAIGLVIVLALLTSVMSCLVFTASAAETKGAFYTVGADDAKGDKIGAASDGYYYINKEFGFYTSDEENAALKGYYVTADSKSALPKDVDAFKNATPAEYDKTSLVLQENKWYVFAEKETTAEFAADTQLLYIYYDTVAPTINSGKLIEWLTAADKGHTFYNFDIVASEEFKLPTDWVKNKEIVTEVSAETFEDGTLKAEYDYNLFTVTVEYCGPNSYKDGEWDSSDDKIDVTSTGFWYFRFLITDKAGNVSETTSEIMRFVIDGDAPEVSFGSSTYTKVSDKVYSVSRTAGQSYTVPTPTSSDTVGSTTTNYEVQKRVNGNWVVIYDTVTKEINEDYEDFVTSSAIKPSEKEIGNAENYLYRVVYTVSDGYGHTSELTLNVITTDPNGGVTDPYEVWKIVLIVIACLAAAGIIVLIFVKPKEEKEVTGRVHYGEKDEDDKKENNGKSKK